MAAECAQIDLYKFLTESELQQYYNAIKNELKISNPAHLKYATDEDLTNIGLSRPEIRRLRKFHEKYFPHGYLSKIKRLLQAPATIVKREDVNSSQSLSGNPNASGGESASAGSSANAAGSPSKVPNNKHIIPADSISVNKQLGTGEFGIVQQGVWTNGTERIQVAIKCLCRERMQSNPMEFLKEAAIMHSIEHENIVRLYGVVLATDSLMLVTELAHLRSLLECLKDSGLRTSFLTVPTLCEFAQQICNGMRYLESKRLIHRDLAARNILVFSKSKVKISDFGLSRALGVGKDYYKTNFNVNLKLPIAWCAPECINYLRFTNASDVWAYGVCLWEMFSYGFQPWAALTGLQILEAIDAPNYQRLEQPECCPSDYYTLMIKCWQDDPAKRPKFSEICELLPEMKPEQLKAAANCLEAKKDHLLYRQGDIITVLDRNTGTPFWKGVLMSGKTGLFNPSNTVAYVEGLPSSNRDSFCRVNERNSTRRKLRTEMISKPQNDLKHTGHVGIDGASFGDIAFLGNSQNYNHVPRQIVTPYKPSEDIEQTPLLLPPTPTSPDSLQTASGYFPDGSRGVTSLNPTFVPSTENTPKHFGQTNQAAFEFPGLNASTNPFAKQQFDDSTFAMQNNNYGIDTEKLSKHAPWSRSTDGPDDMHEYHEISDDEMTADKLDFGPSLLDEINSVFGSMSAGSNSQPKTPDFEQTNIKTEFVETTSKKERKHNLASGVTSLSGGGGLGAGGDSNGNSKFSVSLSRKKTAPGTVKPISVKDEKILNQAIDFANEISARSMVDLVSDQLPTTQSPKRKFSFRFPHLNGNGSGSSNSHDKNARSAGNEETTSSHRFGITSPHTKKKNFTEELKSIPDLQTIIGEEGREAYNSLIERKAAAISPVTSPVIELLETSRTLPRRSTFSHKDNDGNKIDKIATSLATPPPQNAPRPMTLPTRGAASRMRNRVLELNGTCRNPGPDDSCNQENCESPSYLVNTNSTFYKFPDNLENHTDTNPVPLPPRDGKKHIKTNAKRHVRKHPLIIPANGVQRTLNKVTERTPVEEESKWPITQNNNNNNNNNNNSSSNNNNPNTSNLQRVTHEVVATVRPTSMMSSTVKTSDAIYQNGAIEEKMKAARDIVKTDPTYMNLEKNSKYSNGNDDETADLNATATDDTASLQFESILEGDCDKSLVLQSPDVTDGFYNFSIQKEHYNKSKGVVDFDPSKISKLYANEDELRNLDIEQSVRLLPSTTMTAAAAAALAKQALEMQTVSRNKNEKITTIPIASVVEAKTIISSTEKNELAGNALFRKVRQTVEQSISDSESQRKNSTETLNVSAAGGSGSGGGGGGGGSDSDGEKSVERKQTEAEYFAARAARLADSNSVSCEDLLEFADQKPKGRERGPDSDEVRIMTKVLGNQCTAARCLAALESTDWDVHKAIKLLKLQNILPACELSLVEAGEALQQYEWDLHTTALKLRGVKT